jgi:hypothetical protein
VKGAGRDALLLVALKAVLGAWVLHLGFTHVSDDDYSRVVIAQLFAHAPHLDPSGTSWLPFPFWTTGGVMMVLGRSLARAREVAFFLGAISVVFPYLAMRAVGTTRLVAALATLIAAATPWSAWLGVATVPEALTAGLVAAGAITSSAASGRARVWGGVALLAASLSRYETWGACGIVGIVAAWRGGSAWRRGELRTARVDAAVAVLCVLGPAAWIVWNACVHGDAFHFVARVARFQRALPGGEAPLGERVFTYPLALANGAPLDAALGVVALVGLRDGELRRRWSVPLAAAGAILAFLIVSAVRETTATHHAERAIVGTLPVLAAAGIDAVRVWTGRTRVVAWRGACASIATAGAALALFGGQAFPGGSAGEDRSQEIARGEELAREGVGHVEVVPCAYEHFALMAGFGRPEDVDVQPSASLGESTCPKSIEVRP